MHDVLVHYLEVNFPEIAEQLAHTHGREPTNEERAAAAERLRELIRRLRRGAEAAGAPPHAPRASAAEMIAGVNGELSADERAVLDHFFELFARSMQRTQAAIAASPEAAAAAAQPPPEAASATPPAPVAPVAEPATETAVSTQEPAVEAQPVEPVEPPPVAQEPLPVTSAPEPPPPVATAPPEAQAAWLDAGFRGFAAIALSPPLERPVGVLALFRRTPWRLDRRDAVRLEDLAVEAVAALRAHSLAIKVAEVAVLQERLNLAREIHDGLASDLAAVVALFKYYEQRRQRDPEDAGQLLPQLRSMTEEILAGARNILQSLRPKTIRSEGLLASVLKLVDQFGRVNLVETNVSIRGEENTISAEQKEAIFQVLRESLSNVRKHAQARNLWVVVDLSSSPWVLTVRDDGRGFDVRRVAEDPKKVGSYGLVGMRERAELIGGALEIVSQSPEGTLVTLIGPADQSE